MEFGDQKEVKINLFICWISFVQPLLKMIVFARKEFVFIFHNPYQSCLLNVLWNISREAILLNLLLDIGYIEKLNSIRNWLSFSILGKLEILFSISLSYDSNKKQSL